MKLVELANYPAATKLLLEFVLQLKKQRCSTWDMTFLVYWRHIFCKEVFTVGRLLRSKHIATQHDIYAAGDGTFMTVGLLIFCSVSERYIYNQTFIYFCCHRL